MPAFVLHARTAASRRSDGLNVIVVNAADAASAPAAARALFRDGNIFDTDFDDFAVVEFADTTPGFVAQGNGLVGAAIGQSTWPTLTRGGNTL